MKPSLVVHGGAWDIPDEQMEDCRAGCRRALEAGWKILASGGSALNAVEAAIVVLEDEPVFDAGLGSHLNRDGRVQLDAMVMDGRTLGAGSVAAVERVRNPIRLARRVMEASEHVMLVGAGAEQFAREQGMALCDPEELIHPRERAAWEKCRVDDHAAEHHIGHQSGTVGAIAMDGDGNLVAGTSTGGTCCKLPGRVGDSPLVGCGCYADVEAGAASTTGWGEAIMKIVMAKRAADEMGAGKTAAEAARMCIHRLAARAHGAGGLILLDREGIPGIAFNTKRMAFGYVGADGRFVIEP